jgi:hypothetical protein
MHKSMRAKMKVGKFKDIAYYEIFTISADRKWKLEKTFLKKKVASVYLKKLTNAN